MSNEVFSYASPLGALSYCWDGETCHAVDLLDAPATGRAGSNPVSEWLDAYFAGKECPLPPLASPRSAFQSRLRSALLTIPCGETRSYGELADRLHTAPRALGQALGANPLPLLIPCHRIVGANGLGGFSGGLDWKRRLLAFESGTGKQI
jgi:methylated-DNA-[protein]-cysteine S-methyltransferase